MSGACAVKSFISSKLFRGGIIRPCTLPYTHPPFVRCATQYGQATLGSHPEPGRPPRAHFRLYVHVQLRPSVRQLTHTYASTLRCV
jgi:hypothetical protein